MQPKGNSQAYLWQISCITQANLRHISGKSQANLRHTSQTYIWTSSGKSQNVSGIFANLFMILIVLYRLSSTILDRAWVGW